MPPSAHVSGHLWAIAPNGTLHYSLSAAPRWRRVRALPAPAVTLAPCTATSTVVVACADATVHTFHASTASLQTSSPTPLHATPNCLLALAHEHALFAGLSDGAVVRLHLPSLDFDCMLGAGVEHTAAVYALAADTNYLYSAGADAIVLVWTLADLSGVRDFNLPHGPIRSLLRVGFSLWLGLESGAVQVLDIFGDDVNGVTEVALHQPHTRPVMALVRIGEHTIWSLEDIPTTIVDPNAPLVPNVAIWDLRDYSYALADDLHNPLINSIVVTDRAPLERLTIIALSADLNNQFVVKHVSGSLRSSASSHPSAGDYPPPPVASVDGLHRYVADLQEQLANANEHIHYLSTSPTAASIRTADDGALNRPSNDVAPSPSPSPRLDHYLPDSPATASAIANGDSFQDDGDATGEHFVAHKDLKLGRVDALQDDVTASLTPDAVPMPLSISDALQNALANLADLLVALLTDHVLATDSGDMLQVQNNQSLTKTVATLTKELNIAKQLVSYCTSTPSCDPSVDPDDLDAIVQHATAAATSAVPISPTDTHAIVQDDVIRNLRRRLDDSTGRTDQLEADLRDAEDEHVLLKDDLDQVRTQSETTLTSLEGLIREHETKLADRDATIAQLRAEVNGQDEALRKERLERQRVEQCIVDETSRLAEMAQQAATEYETQLQSSYDKIETKAIEIQSQRDSHHVQQVKLNELRSTHSDLENRYRQVEGDLSDATNAVETARKELANNIAMKEAQHQDAMYGLRLERDQEIANLKAELASLHDEHTHFRVELEGRCDELRSEVEATRQEKGNELIALRDKTNLQVESLESQLTVTQKNAMNAKKRVCQLEAELLSLSVSKDRQLSAVQTQLDDERRDRQTVVDGEMAKEREIFGSELEERDSTIKAVENKRDLLERQIAGREAIVEKLQSRCTSLERKINDGCSSIEQLEKVRDRLERQVWDQEATVERLEVEARCSTTHIRRTSDDEREVAGDVVEEERELLRKEVEHRRAAAELYEAELQSMRSVIDDLRLAAGEVETALDGREEESRRLQMTVNELRAALRMREMRIGQLEGRVAAAVAISESDDADIRNDMEAGKTTVRNMDDTGVDASSCDRRVEPIAEGTVQLREEVANLKAMRALLASANGEIGQMGRELEAMYRAQFSREKELESLREAVDMRDAEVRKKDLAIDKIRTMDGRCEPCERCGCLVGNAIVERGGGDRVDCTGKRCDVGGEGNTMLVDDNDDDDDEGERLIKATLLELHEGMVVTQDKLRDVTRLAREYKTVAQSHLEVLPALYETEQELERMGSHMRQRVRGDASLLAEQRVSCVHGVVQSVIAQYYTPGQKRGVIRGGGASGGEDSRFAASGKRLAALQATVKRMRRLREGPVAAKARADEARGGRMAEDLK